MISQKSVQEIFETAKIEEVVGNYVNLRKRGVNLIGLCPFHHEKTPSFTVSPSKNIYKCFGCGKGGNAVQFLMEHENFSYPDALRQLAKLYNIELDETIPNQEALEQRQLMDSLFIVNSFAKEFYQKQLFDSPEGRNIGLSYFKERGFREDIIKKFGLGYAPKERERLTKSALGAGYNIELLQKLGLSNKFEKDFFWNRVMFSIHNLSGKVVGFAGRTLQSNIKVPKYINSPETEIYIKNKVLYGSFFAKKAIRQQDECILVEGYTDVLSLHQAGIENVVASSGTSLTPGQIALIKRNTNNVKILYDGDFAGVKAALRGLDLLLQQDMNVKVIMLPKNEDPDSYLQKIGTTDFKTFLDSQAQDFILFKADLLLKEAEGDPVKKSQIVREIVNSIGKIPDPIKRAIYIKECATLIEIEESTLLRETNKLVAGYIQKKKGQQDRQKSTGYSEFPTREYPMPLNTDQKVSSATIKERTKEGSFQERDIARLLVAFGGEIFEKDSKLTVAEYLIKNIEETINDFDNVAYGKIVQGALERLRNKYAITKEFFINHVDPEISKTAIDLIHNSFEYSPGWEERDIFLRSQKAPELNFTNDSIQALRRFKLGKIMQLCDKNAERIKALNNSDDQAKLIKLVKLQQKLIENRNELAQQLNTVILK